MVYGSTLWHTVVHLYDLVWETYLKSGGNDVVEMFRKNLAEEYSEDYAKQIRSMVARYCPMDSVLNELEERLMQLCLSESIETVAQGQDFPEQQQTNSDTSLSGEENLEEYDIIDALMDDEYDHLYGMLQEENQAEPRPQDVFCAFIFKGRFCGVVIKVKKFGF